MSDLHERLLAAVNERLELARAAQAGYPGPWAPDDLYGGKVEAADGDAVAHDIPGDHLAPFIAANDPASVIRHCERDLGVLGRHVRYRIPKGYEPEGRLNCFRCNELKWPCTEIADLATAYDIDSALAAPQRLERGGSAPPS
jgi:hypothetical protein